VDRAPLYREAIDFLVLLQDRGTRDLPAESPARKTVLNEEKFLWELGQFHRHFLLGYRGARLHPLEEELFQQFYGWLCASLESVERVLCHRDFQSRNLMVTPHGLRVIDYQDARLGPVPYDLASLLRDSSLDLDADLVEEGIRYFLSRRGGLAEEEFRDDFSRVALQRNIKDLGTFGYQVHSAQNLEYETYIPRTLEMVRRGLLGDRRYHDIFPIFEKHVFNGRAGSTSPASR
jgi:aminoglycoside/choline kinase family phosphotransferase